MELDQMLASSGTDIGALAAKFGISPEQASAGLGSLMPAIVGGFQKKAETGDLDAVTNVASDMGQPDTPAGNDILGHIFGSKDVSRQVADHAAGQSGLSSTILKSMLPIVAAMVAKKLAGSSGSQSASGGLGGMLGSILGGSGGLAGLGGLLGGAGSAGGNPLDQILGRMR